MIMQPNNDTKLNVIIISASSDIGFAMCQKWRTNGWNVFGTYRTKSSMTDRLINTGVKLFRCDLLNKKEIESSCRDLRKECSIWDVLVFCPGTQKPVGSFIDSEFPQWEESVQINLISQLHVLHELLPNRNLAAKLKPCVLFFAGGGTNSAPINYSAYTLSKIALIKMCELLDAEIADTRFTIVGPGWVKTKIHEETLAAGKTAGNNYQKTKDKLSGNTCTSMEDVLKCCDWIIQTPKEVTGGRNFSVVFDQWGSEALSDVLKRDFNMYKLRRYGNDHLIKKELLREQI